MSDFDLDAYLARIRIDRGGLAPDLPALRRLLHAHIHAIPFENLDVLLGRPIRLDLPSVQAKLVTARRGGYCFEHATLFAAALEAVGFEPPQRHAARVVLTLRPSEAPRTHLFLSLGLDGRRYILDPGFGALEAHEPMPLVDAPPAPNASGPAHWLARDGEGRWTLRARDDHGRELDAWTSTLEAELPIDAELGNHYTSTHPRSLFVNRLMLRAFGPAGRIALMNRELTIRRGDTVERHQLADRGALRTLLLEQCGIDLPEVETLRVPLIPEWE